MDLRTTRWLEGKEITVREYLKLMAENVLPVVDDILLNLKKITFDELINEHINEKAIFFNDAKYEYDDEEAWQIDRFSLLLEDEKA